MVHALKRLCTLLIENPLEEQFTNNVDKLLLHSPLQKRECHSLVPTISHAGNTVQLLPTPGHLRDSGLWSQRQRAPDLITGGRAEPPALGEAGPMGALQWALGAPARHSLQQHAAADEPGPGGKLSGLFYTE